MKRLTATVVIGAALLAAACGSTTNTTDTSSLSSSQPAPIHLSAEDVVGLMKPSDIQGLCADFQAILAAGGTASMAESVFANGYTPSPGEPGAESVFTAIMARCGG